MIKTRLFIIMLLTVALLPATVAGQNRDQGQWLILNAQYGTPNHHVDVTNRLKDLARRDQMIRMDNQTFGVDPDRGHIKSLRIFARGPNGEERMFEFAEYSTIDGAQFRGWGQGDWGNEQWDGGWEGHRHGGQPQPAMTDALQHLREAQQSLQSADSDKGGHRVNAMQLINQAIGEIEAGIRYDNDHDRDGDHDRH